MKKIMMIFGTRPEGIKMIPVIKELRKKEGIKLEICISGQHRELLNDVLRAHKVTPDFDLKIMKEAQSLFDITTLILEKTEAILKESAPNAVIVHGDTSTAFAAALAGFYLNIPIIHIEAGLRTYNMYSPYPEEFNRRAISLVASWHFSPTETARKNLLQEGIDKDRIFVTGNTAVDAVLQNISDSYTHKELEYSKNKKLVILTLHRRETSENDHKGIMRAVLRTVKERNDTMVLVPIHPNPRTKKYIEDVFGKEKEKIHLCEPLESFDFHNIMARSYAVLTDSGGIQEEAPALGVPVLLLRNATERAEGIECGAAMNVGTNEMNVYRSLNALLDDPKMRADMSASGCPYGDGKASERIVNILETII